MSSLQPSGYTCKDEASFLKAALDDNETTAMSRKQELKKAQKVHRESQEENEI